LRAAPARPGGPTDEKLTFGLIAATPRPPDP
jgi:hypothetical protein